MIVDADIVIAPFRRSGFRLLVAAEGLQLFQTFFRQRTHQHHRSPDAFLRRQIILPGEEQRSGRPGAPPACEPAQGRFPSNARRHRAPC